MTKSANGTGFWNLVALLLANPAASKIEEEPRANSKPQSAFCFNKYPEYPYKAVKVTPAIKEGKDPLRM